jgi:hypothetical protein
MREVETPPITNPAALHREAVPDETNAKETDMAKSPAVVVANPLLLEETKSKSITVSVEGKVTPKDLNRPLQFLLTCSETSLSNFQMVKLSEAANFRKQAHKLMDAWYEAALQAELARLFRAQGRERILRALAQPFDAIADAKTRLHPREVIPEGYVPPLPLPKGQAHRTASMTYQKRNVEDGLCCVCPTPLARNSVLYCEKHLTACRERARTRARKQRGDTAPAAAAVAIATN